MTTRFALVFLLLAGCSFESAPVTEMVDNRCGSDADCQAGVCDGRICIDDSDAAVEVAIEVVGSASEAQRVIPASWAFGSEPFSGSNVRDLILPATREVPKRLQHPKRRTIGLRVPDHPLVRAVLQELGEPIMSSTLLLPGDDLPLTDPHDIEERIGHEIDLIIDAGPTGIEPTSVIDLSEDRVEVLRVGRGDVSALV